MLRYATKIVVAADRYICLQLPDGFPEGAAVVTVHFHDPSRPSIEAPDDDPDREDIEWWDEFEEEHG